MIDRLVHRPTPVELTSDAGFARRIRRLTLVSAVALGLIFGLALLQLEAPPVLWVVLATGWLLMPLTLVASLSRPRLRYALVLPASMVSIGLVAVCVGWLPEHPASAAGWVLVTAGVALGGGLGLWLWYRLLPVPARLDAPFSRGRWALIAVHVVLIVAGLVLVAIAG